MVGKSTQKHTHTPTHKYTHTHTPTHTQALPLVSQMLLQLKPCAATLHLSSRVLSTGPPCQIRSDRPKPRAESHAATERSNQTPPKATGKVTARPFPPPPVVSKPTESVKHAHSPAAGHAALALGLLRSPPGCRVQEKQSGQLSTNHSYSRCLELFADGGMVWTSYDASLA